MKLIAYTLGRGVPDIKPSSVKRQWMDDTPESYAYRCLPLNIANQHGWEVRSPCNFSATWNGGLYKEATVVTGDGGPHEMPVSHFGSGIITFHLNVLIKTDPGYNLFVMGPTNGVKDGVAPLNGIIETDWSPYSFTMNLRLTRPNHTISYAKGEPYCCFFPIPRGLVEETEPEFQPISNNPDLQQRHTDWSQSRKQFLTDLKDPEAQARQQKWQKLYYRGVDVDGEKEFPEHQIKLNVKPFKGGE